MWKYMKYMLDESKLYLHVDKAITTNLLYVNHRVSNYSIYLLVLNMKKWIQRYLLL